MDVKDLRQKNRQELAALVLDLRSQMHAARFRLASRDGKAIKAFRDVKRDLARTLATIHEIDSSSRV
jgi:ribosomal protein L29